MKIRTTSARVTLTLDIAVRSTWGADCSMEQVHRQATEEAVGYIKRLTDKDRNCVLVKDPEVVAVMATAHSEFPKDR